MKRRIGLEIEKEISYIMDTFEMGSMELVNRKSGIANVHCYNHEANYKPENWRKEIKYIMDSFKMRQLLNGVCRIG